ncbi:hypothetical protein [Parendozoicomonas sp. Alg238-R29]|uniref:hypothetical protein n=1 Tax=Parendozoicomonas sp. Alg238-R29 TaxID=2993446 RepID=UPI00248DFDA0|nr:hypothetical protein [Parendozoicomonas sp. Alg238-R29]
METRLRSFQASPTSTLKPSRKRPCNTESNEATKRPRIVVSCQRYPGPMRHQGWGDFAFGKKICDGLNKSFPSASLQLVAHGEWSSIDNRRVEKIIEGDGLPVTLVNYNKTQTRKQKQSIEKTYREADIIISGPAVVVDEVLPYLADKTIVIREYKTCADQIPKYASPPISFSQTGLHHNGVFMCSPRIEDRKLQNPILKKYLGETIPRCEFDFPSKALYYSYNKMCAPAFVFAAASVEQDRAKDVYVVTTIPQGEVEFLFRYKNKLKRFGITEIILVKDGKEQKTPSSKKPNQPGKRLFVIDIPVVTNHDLELLIDGAGPLIGITGDISFSSVLAAGKFPTPYYFDGYYRQLISCIPEQLQDQKHPLREYLSWTCHVLNTISPDELLEDRPLCLTCPKEMERTNNEIVKLISQLRQERCLENFIEQEVRRTELITKK